MKQLQHNILLRLSAKVGWLFLKLESTPNYLKTPDEAYIV